MKLSTDRSPASAVALVFSATGATSAAAVGQAAGVDEVEPVLALDLDLDLGRCLVGLTGKGRVRNRSSPLMAPAQGAGNVGVGTGVVPGAMGLASVA
jgi:hypothetical protein